MKDCVTLEAIVCDEDNVHVSALLGDLIFLKESFKLSYENAPKHIQRALAKGYVLIERPQLFYDGALQRQAKRRLASVPFMQFISSDFGEHSLRVLSSIYDAYCTQLEDFYGRDLEVEKDVFTR